ncbi:MAG TPA: outer membrane beta-barrel protein [Chitinophagales bacterium]|nr:outer membrane beta-barrel protein [Chitinophagales bacterium]
MKSCLLIIILSLVSSVVVAQMDTCISNLKSAATYYADGSYDEAITILNSTLKVCPLSKQDQIQANKLLILCYLGIDNIEAANSAAAAIMKIDPTYTPDKFKDDPKLSSLFKKFKPEPTLAVSVGGGINIPDVHVVQTYSVVHADTSAGLASYKSVFDYQLMAGIEKRVYRNLWVEAGFEFRNTDYKHILDSVESSTIFYRENIDYFDFPLSLKFYFLRNALMPYVQAGVDFSFLSKALSTTTRNDQKDLVDRTALRNGFDLGYFGAAGASYSVRLFRIFGEIGFTYFPGFINKAGARYADDINLYKYYYVDDDFKMNNIQFNLGISYILAHKITKVK